MSRENITIQDCLGLYEKKGIITVIENGQVIRFAKEQVRDAINILKEKSSKDGGHPKSRN